MYQTFTKRLIDLTLATILLILALPVIVVIAVLIKLESKGPVIFTQERTGLQGKTFRMRKFRSMTAYNDIHDRSKKNEVTRIGKLLRRFSLDEIPQFINVLLGDMSFIGPRPWITEYYKHMNASQRQRNSVRPGITGLAQAYGRNKLTIHQKINYDLTYVKNISFMMDIKVIIVTLYTIFHKSTVEIDKDGIHNELAILKAQGNSIVIDEEVSSEVKAEAMNEGAYS